jgi:hypothetical protein
MHSGSILGLPNFEWHEFIKDIPHGLKSRNGLKKFVFQVLGLGIVHTLMHHKNKSIHPLTLKMDTVEEDV